jgi:hypothetical protein
VKLLARLRFFKKKRVLDITLATVLDQAAVAVRSVVEGSDFDVMIQDRINNYIQSYLQEMNDEMIKFAKIFFTDNETIEHYIREVALSATEIGGIQEQLGKEIKARSKWILRDIENISLGRTDALFVTRIFYAIKVV